MSTKKNVLLLIPNLDFGGAQRSFCNLANALNEIHQVYVCVFNTINGVAYHFDTDIIDLNIPGGKTTFAKAKYFIYRCKAVARLKKRLNIHATVSYLEGANYVNVITGGHDKVIISVRGSMLHDPNITGLLGFIRLKILLPLSCRFANHIVALNYGIRSELINQMGVSPASRVAVIRNFYSIPLIESLSREPLNGTLSALNHCHYIIYAGRLSKEKGLVSIIDVYRVLVKNNPGLKLVLVGDGPVREDLIRHALSNNLRVSNNLQKIDHSQVIFLGYQENPYNVLSKASLLILASSAEGGPNVVREAMLCGTLVISTNCPYGPAELLIPTEHWTEESSFIEGKYGVLIPMTTVRDYQRVIDMWANVIEQYLMHRHKSKMIVEAARNWARQQSVERTLTKWLEIIDQGY